METNIEKFMAKFFSMIDPDIENYPPPPQWSYIESTTKKVKSRFRGLPKGAYGR